MVPAMLSVGFRFCVLLLFAGFVAPARYLAEPNQLQLPENHVALFVFGDSLYDPGNNNYLNVPKVEQGNYPPFGETFFHNSTGRRSDGRLVPDFIAMYANLSLWKPYFALEEEEYINGANFASAGACVLAENCVPDDNYDAPLTLGKELSYFIDVNGSLTRQLGDAEELLQNAVYLTSIGSADYFWFVGKYPNATQIEKQEYVNWVVGNITDTIKEIYKLGGRKFTFQNVPPMGCWPATKHRFNLSCDECLDELLELPSLHNEALATALRELETEFSGFKFLSFDYYNALYERIMNPSQYGFKEARIACCGSGNCNGANCGLDSYCLCGRPEEYLFFDSAHPSEHGQSQLAEMLWYGLPNITRPFGMKQFFQFQNDTDTCVQDDGAFADE